MRHKERTQKPTTVISTKVNRQGTYGTEELNKPNEHASASVYKRNKKVAELRREPRAGECRVADSNAINGNAYVASQKCLWQAPDNVANNNEPLPSTFNATDVETMRREQPRRPNSSPSKPPEITAQHQCRMAVQQPRSQLAMVRQSRQASVRNGAQGGTRAVRRVLRVRRRTAQIGMSRVRV